MSRPLLLCEVLFLVRHTGLSQRYTAERMGMRSGSAACRQLASAEQWLEADAALRPAATKAERLLVVAQVDESTHA